MSIYISDIKLSRFQFKSPIEHEINNPRDMFYKEPTLYYFCHPLNCQCIPPTIIGISQGESNGESGWKQRQNKRGKEDIYQLESLGM